MNGGPDVPLSRGRRLTLPAGLSPGTESGIDTDVTSWSGRGFRLTIDDGPFADPLTQPGGPAGGSVEAASIDGRPARLARFDDPDGQRVVAVHFPGEGLTVVNRFDPTRVSEEAALEVMRDLKFRQDT